MKLRKRLLSFILSVSMFGVLVPNIALAEETTEGTTPEETVTDTFEVTINPENYASIYLQKGSAGTADAGYHVCSRAKQLHYNTLYTSYKNIYSEHASLISGFKVPLKNTINAMTVTYSLYSVKNLKNGSVPIFYNFTQFLLNTPAGIYAGPSSTTTTDDAGNSVTTEIPASEQYASVKSFTENYWVSTGTTNHKYTNVPYASQVAASMTTTTAPSTGTTAFALKDTVLTAFKEDKTSDYITLATGRETSGYIELQYSMDTASEIPYLTATYSKAAILETINASEKADLPELFKDLDAVGLLANTTAGYTGYSSLIDIAKDYVETEIANDILAGGFADLDAFYASYDEHVAFAAENGTLIAINNVKSVEEMTLLIEELGVAGTLENSTSGYAGFTSLSALMEKQVIAALYEDVANGGYETVEAFFASYDEAVAAAAELTQEDAVTATVSPENYAVIHITDEGYHGYSRTERVFYNAPYKDNAKFYSESGSVITSYRIPLKNMLSAMAINYSVNTAGQMSNGHVPVFYDINKFEIDVPAGSYDMIVEDTTTDDTTTGETVTDDTTVEDTTTTPDSGLDDEEEEGSDGSVDIPTEGETPEVVTKDVYAEVLNYTSNYWPTSGYSYTNSNVAYKITSSATGRPAHDVTNTAMKAFLANETAEYLTFATGRETSGYMNFSVNVSTDATIPTLTLTYDAAKLIDYINAANSADELDEILATLNEAGILTNSLYGYAAYTGVGEKYREEIRETLYEQVANGGYLKFIDFINKYDETVLFVANNVINNPDVLINFNDETASDVTGNGNDAQIVGDATFTVGPDGSKALKIANTFGKKAQQYLNMGEYDLTEDSFSIVFWMKAPGRGIKYEETGDSIAAGTVVDFSAYTGTSGGVVLSNKDFSINDNTGFAFAAMPIYADFSYNMKLGDNSVLNTVGVQTAIDSRWHQISYVVNRAGKATFYVDNTIVKETDISKLTGSLGVDDIIFGADGLGQYGMNKGEFDDIRIYSSALEASKIEELYYKTALDKVNSDIEIYLTGDNSDHHTEANIAALEEKLSESKTFVENYEVGNTEALIAQYNEIDEYFNIFLNKDVNGVAAWGSDVHISEPSESHLNAQNLRRFLTESADWENPAKSFVLSGDLADVGADDLRYFFGFLDNWVVEGSNMAICRGNHDEPVGSEKDTGISYTRAELKDKYVAWMDKYVNKKLSLNADVINAEGNLAQPFYYSTDGAAHYLSVDIYWPTSKSISDSQIAWLKKVLDKISGDGKPIFFIMHNPLYGTQPRVELDKNQLSKAADTKIKNLVKDYDNIFILTGHHHEGLGAGDGDPFKVKLDDGTETGVWLLNTTVLCSKGISRGYEWAGGYYINIYDDKVVFRGRDFENQKWLREYDMTFDLVPAKEKTSMGDIKLINLEDNSEYADIASAAGKLVKVQVPVKFVDEAQESFDTILSLYSETGLLSANQGIVSVNNEYIEYEVEIPSDTKTIKVMCFESIENMVPVCEAAVLTAASKAYNFMTFNIRTITDADKNERSWENRKAAVVEYLNNSGADVIVMQEVEFVGQADYIPENISEKYGVVYYPAMANKDDSGGLMVAYDKEVFENVGENRFWLSETPDVESFGWDASYKRICVNVQLKDKANGEVIHVFNVHLDNTGTVARQKGIELIMERVNASQYPTFVAGDFNAKNTTDVYSIISSQMQDCQVYAPQTDDGVTYNGWGSNSDYSTTPIDFCFVSKDRAKPLEYKICRDKWDGNFYSDHYAVKTKVRVLYAE